MIAATDEGVRETAELHHGPPVRLLLRRVGGHLRRLQRDVPRRGLQLQPHRAGPAVAPADRDAEVRRPADPRWPRRRHRLPRGAVQHRWPRPDADRRWRGRPGSAPSSTCRSSIHLPLAILVGMAVGALWGGIAGLLKARTGAHEVIVTIMLNYVAYYLLFYALAEDFLFKTPGVGQPEVAADEGDRDPAQGAGRPVQPAPRLRARARRGGRRVVAAQPLHPRLPHPRGRREPARRARLRHQRRRARTRS